MGSPLALHIRVTCVLCNTSTSTDTDDPSILGGTVKYITTSLSKYILTLLDVYMSWYNILLYADV
mgnify:CR=1 FL=1